MPRPTTFNSDVVLDRAMRVFWTYGYTATSVQNLVEKTKLLRGSIYNTFGDKRSLYIQSLQHYGQIVMRRAAEIVEKPGSPLAHLRALFMEVVEMSPEEKRRGSMICNCIVEVVPHDKEIGKVVEGIVDEFKAVIQSTLERAEQAGELSPRADTQALTHYLASNFQGLCVTAKGGAPREELLDIVNVTLSVLC